MIDSATELTRARALVDRLWDSDDPSDIAKLQAQPRLIAAYEQSRWPRRRLSTADLIRHLIPILIIRHPRLPIRGARRT